MPKYEFECRECSHAFEISATVDEYTRMRREKRITCPDCRAQKVIRVFSAPNIASASPANRQGGSCCCPGGQCR